MIQKSAKLVVALVVALGIGATAGLLYGLVLSPATYTNVDPEDLAQPHKQEYFRLAALDYLENGDLLRASQTLQELGYDVETAASMAEDAAARGDGAAYAMALLATDLGAPPERLAAVLGSATPTPRPTATASQTPLPSATPSPTPPASRTVAPTETPPPSATRPPTGTVPASTPLPVATQAAPTSVPTVVPTSVSATPAPPTEPPATPTVTPTVPTATPSPPPATPTPAIDFVVQSTRMMSIEENGGCVGRHNAFVTVLDAAGNRLNGVAVALRWATGEEQKFTGHKPERPGMAEFDLYGGYTLHIVADNGRLVRSEQSRQITSEYPAQADLLAAGYCSDVADCEYRQNANPPQLCFGHYSWDVVFRRTY